MNCKAEAPSYEPGAMNNHDPISIIQSPTVPEASKESQINLVLRDLAESGSNPIAEELALQGINTQHKVGLKTLKAAYAFIKTAVAEEKKPIPEPPSQQEIDSKKKEQEIIQSCVQQIQQIADLHPTFHHHLSNSGFVCDPSLASTILLTHGARLLQRSTAFFFTGASGSGKTDGVVKGSKFLPPETVLSLTSVSDQALYYLGDIQHRYLLFGEMAPRVDEQDDFRQMATRQLISENKITRAVVEKVDGKSNICVMKETEGPCVIVATTTKEPDKFNDELQNRASWVLSNDSKDITDKVLDIIAKRACNPAEANDPNEAFVVKGFQEFHRTLKPLMVAIPFAQFIKPTSTHVTVRRLSNLILDYIRANALLHQHSRVHAESNGQKMVVATLEDYDLAYRVATANAPRVLESCSPRARAVFYEILKPAFEEQKRKGVIIMNTGQCLRLMKEPDSTARRWLNDYAKSGLLIDSGKVGKQNVYSLPDDQHGFMTQDLGLVHPDQVREAMRIEAEAKRAEMESQKAFDHLR